MNFKTLINKKVNMMKIASVLIVFNIIYFVLTKKLVSSQATASLFGETFLPMILNAGLVVSIIIYIVVGVKKDNDAYEVDKFFGSNKAMLVSLLVFALYLIILPRLGFKLSSPIFLFLLIRLIGAKHAIWMTALISVFTTVLAYYIFQVGFKVFLPYGIF